MVLKSTDAHRDPKGLTPTSSVCCDWIERCAPLNLSTGAAIGSRKFIPAPPSRRVAAGNEQGPSFVSRLKGLTHA